LTGRLWRIGKKEKTEPEGEKGTELPKEKGRKKDSSRCGGISKQQEIREEGKLLESGKEVCKKAPRGKEPLQPGILAFARTLERRRNTREEGKGNEP